MLYANIKSPDEFLVFRSPNHISRMDEARVAKFCMHVKYIKC